MIAIGIVLQMAVGWMVQDDSPMVLGLAVHHVVVLPAAVARFGETNGLPSAAPGPAEFDSRDRVRDRRNLALLAIHLGLDLLVLHRKRIKNFDSFRSISFQVFLNDIQ